MCSTVILANEKTHMIKFQLSINSRTKKSKKCIKHRGAYSSNRDGGIIAFKERPFLMHLYIWYSVTLLPFFSNLYCIVRLRVVPIFPQG